MKKLTQRRWAACQAIQTLGPAASSAAPELVEIFKSNDQYDLNAATMALHAIGINAEICERLNALMEKGGLSVSARAQIVSALGNVKPPSQRSLNVLVAALRDSSAYVPGRAAETLGRLGVRTPEIVAGLKQLQSNSTNGSDVVASSLALWELEKDPSLVLAPVFRILDDQMSKPVVRMPGRGQGGQGVTAPDQLFMGAAELFRKMHLNEPEKSRALALLEAWGEKSRRIFIQMLLLPAMVELGLPRERCLEICKTGLDQEEDYLRIQAARLLTVVSDKHYVTERDLYSLSHDSFVGVRVYAAKVHWLKYRQANAVVPVLIEALDRSKHQSYFYKEIQPVALAALADIGPGAQEATGTLEKLTRDPNPEIAKLASEALVKIRK